MNGVNEGIFAHWPNRITALRFLGALSLFAIFAVYGDSDMAGVKSRRGVFQVAFWLFIATSLSDILDGWLARRGNNVTAFGRIADPFVDKVLVMGAMVFLAVMPWSRPWFPAWIVVVILSREFLITAIRGYVESVGAAFPADWFGKVKMFLQCWAVGIVVGLAAFEFPPDVRQMWGVIGHLCVLATLLASVGSGVTYVLKTRRMLARSPR